MIRFLFSLILLSSVVGVSAADLTDTGVSLALAQHRKAAITNLAYDLFFSIPEDKTSAVEAKEQITLTLAQRETVIIDFREAAEKIHSIKVNGKACDYDFRNEHIIIPKKYTLKGSNAISIAFTAGNQSLNRRDGYVYTLFVPDRARTVFPCFEQPNLKAQFTLHLEVPATWKAVSNTCVDSLYATKNAGGATSADAISAPSAAVKDAISVPSAAKTAGKTDSNRKTIHFQPTEPLSTYLFAFAAGEFSYETYTEEGRTIGAYYRETDTKRTAQLPDIFRQVMFALQWQEDFTGVKYPFQKYDLVILPGFQFGGMEHTGATFYNDNTIFLSENPTPDERLRRTELIAHETSHMWFGDAVTMEWFDDVWTKEVFANYFAAEITTPLFPDINHNLNWLKTYVAAAVAQDRTDGRTSIRQPLDNMRNAGLIYNNIIYNKAPVMMRKMVELMGKDAFRRGIQRYVKTYLYGNATWDDLIAILDTETPHDLRAFSKEWVDNTYWPHYTAKTFLDARDTERYGYLDMTSSQTTMLMHYWLKEKDATARQAMLMTLQENYLNGKIKHGDWFQFLYEMLCTVDDQLTMSTLISYMYEPMLLRRGNVESERALWNLLSIHKDMGVRKQVVRLLASRAATQEITDSLFVLWQNNDSPLLSINDYNTLAYELAVRMPERADSIIKVQRARNTDPDRLRQFDFVSRAVDPSESNRDALFASLSDAGNRRIEPWTLSVLYYLNHPLRDRYSVKYIRPALDMLTEIQRTGDIFFPASWCSNLLAGHRCPEAYQAVESFLSDNPDMLPLLRNKILTAAHNLKKAQQRK